MRLRPTFDHFIVHREFKIKKEEEEEKKTYELNIKLTVVLIQHRYRETFISIIKLYLIKTSLNL